MTAAPKADLPWGRLALGLTGLLLTLLVERSLRHEPSYVFVPIEVQRPRGVVDDFSPIEWTGGDLTGTFRFVVVVRDGEVGGEGELLRSPFLETNSWELPEGASDGWDHVRIRVYVVDSTKPEDELLKRPPMKSNETVAMRPGG